MDLRQLEVFLAVMEHGTVTKTAERLHVSPGAVSLQLQGLAAELRTQLFVRSGKRIVPTPHAHRLASHAQEIMTKVGEIESEFGENPAADTKEFHFATGATTLIYKLGRPLTLLRKQFPHADVRITVAATERIVDGLLDRTFDLGLISLPLEHPGLTVAPLFDEELLVIRPSAQPARDASIGSVSPEEMAKAPFLLFPRGSNMRALIDRFLGELGVAPSVTTEADDTEVIKRLVESGFGYSILPEFALGSKGQFQRLRVPGKRLVRQQALAMPKSQFPRPLTLAVAHFLKPLLSGKHSVVR